MEYPGLMRANEAKGSANPEAALERQKQMLRVSPSYAEDVADTAQQLPKGAPRQPTPSLRDLRRANDTLLDLLGREVARIEAMATRAGGEDDMKGQTMRPHAVPATLADELWEQNRTLYETIERLTRVANQLDRIQ